MDGGRDTRLRVAHPVTGEGEKRGLDHGFVAHRDDGVLLSRPGILVGREPRYVTHREFEDGARPATEVRPVRGGARRRTGGQPRTLSAADSVSESDAFDQCAEMITGCLPWSVELSAEQADQAGR